MNVKVAKRFRDAKTKKVWNPGDIITDISAERLSEINGTKYGMLAEPMETATQDEKANAFAEQANQSTVNADVPMSGGNAAPEKKPGRPKKQSGD